jgi:hypothetical protein
VQLIWSADNLTLSDGWLCAADSFSRRARALTGKCMADRGTHERKPLASHFATTQWSLIAAVGGKSVNATVRRKALEMLCEVYWFPLCAFIRRRGCKQADAEDLTQGFLARLIERNEFADADPARGRLRTFLLAGLRHFVSNQHDRDRRLKHGRGYVICLRRRKVGAVRSFKEPTAPKKWSTSLNAASIAQGRDLDSAGWRKCATSFRKSGRN